MLNHSNEEVVVMPILNDKQIANFWKKINIPEDKSLCWEWEGYKNEKGYGRMDINTKEHGMKTYYSHRLAYFLQYGIDPLDKLICHSCDNPKCQNGKHLFVGTIQDNNADAAKKNRSLVVKGEGNIMSKLTESEVKDIIYDYYTNKLSFNQLSKKYNNTASNIRKIVDGESWSYINHKEISKNAVKRQKLTKVFNVLNEPQRAEVRILYLENKGVPYLAKMYSTSETQIYSIVKDIMLEKIPANAVKRKLGFGNSKLNEQQVLEIRDKYNNHKTPIKDLSEIFYISLPVVYKIVRNKSWKHLLPKTG